MQVDDPASTQDLLVANLETLGGAKLGCQGSRTRADSSAFIPGKGLVGVGDCGVLLRRRSESGDRAGSSTEAIAALVDDDVRQQCASRC
jgi:hypothetical protein